MEEDNYKNRKQQKQNDVSGALFSRAAHREAVQRGKIRGKNKQPKVRRTLITEGFLNICTFDFGKGTKKDF